MMKNTFVSPLLVSKTIVEVESVQSSTLVGQVDICYKVRNQNCIVYQVFFERVVRHSIVIVFFHHSCYPINHGSTFQGFY